MEPLRPAPPFDLNSEANREARALFSTTTQQSTGRPVTSSSRTSANGTATIPPSKTLWDDVCASSSEDEEDRPVQPPSSSSATIAPPPSAAVAGVDVDVAAAGGIDGDDSDDSEFNKYFPSRRVAGPASPSTCHLTSRTLGSPSLGPCPASTSGGPSQADRANAASSGGSSPCGSAGRKRRREGKDGVVAADRAPPIPRRTHFGSDSYSSGGDDDELRKMTGHLRSKAPSSGEARGRSPRASVSPVHGQHDDDGMVRSGSDTDSDLGGRGYGGGGATNASTLRRGGGQRQESGSDKMQVGFDSDLDSDSDLGGGAATSTGSAQQRGSGQGAVMGEEEEEERDHDDEHDDGDGDGLKPTLSHAPFTDAEMRPLVLTNDSGGERAEVPASVNRYLKDYQREGVEFMYRRVRHADGPKGVILADDMGLGKTVQTVSLLLALLKKKGTGQDLKDLKSRRRRNLHASAGGKPVLIVCPRTVLPSWEKHLAEWGHFASRSILTGGSSTGRSSLQGVESLLKAGRLEVVVVGETMFSNSVDTLAELDWLAVVFDEVHHFKNPQTNKAQAAEKMNKAEVFIGLTGTLVQNELDELWTVMNMIAPGCLGARDDFRQHFTVPYLRGRKRGASRADCLMASERLKELFVLRDKLVLRREKSILGDLLKGKIGTVVFCDLTEVQKLIYRTVLALPEFRLLATANEPCPCGRVDAKSGSCCGQYPKDDTSEDGVDPKAVIWRRFHAPNLELCDTGPGCPYCCAFSAISKLQKLANHPCLLQVKPMRDYEGQQQKRLDDIAFAQEAFSEQALAIMTTRPGGGDDAGAGAVAAGGGFSGGSGAVGGGENWDRRLARPENFLQLCRDDTCGKMKTLKVLLERFKNKDKVLLFSYSTAMLDILQMLCSSEGYTFLRLDGNTAKDQRPKMIERFAKEDAFGSNIFLISTKAGGTGLNLQSANKVILYDVNWNPAQDAQAEDRAYRIGQLRDVEVFRLVSTGTIEELTYMRQIYKLQTSAATMGDKSEGGLRQFEGVQGDSSQQGELWGISNLMKFSGESMLMKLRQEHGAGLPPLVPDSKDGLVMEPQENIVNIVNNYAAAENSVTQQEEEHAPGGKEEQGEEEEEFDDAGWGGGGGDGGGGGGVGGRATDKNVELGGVVMLHDDMVAADREQELPPGTQESINEVQMMEDNTEDEAMNESMDEAMDEAMDVSGGGGAASNTTACNTVSQELDVGEEGAAAGHPAASTSPSPPAPPATHGRLAAGAGSGGQGGVGAGGGSASRLVSQASDDADSGGGGGGGDGGPAAAGGQVCRDEGEQTEAEAVSPDEPSWALAPTQPPDFLHHGVVPSPPPVSLSLPSGTETGGIDPDQADPGGPSGAAMSGTAGGPIAGGGGAAGSTAEADGEGVSSQAEAVAGAAVRGQGGGVFSEQSSEQFLYAPAAQDVLDVLDYVDGGDGNDAREGEESTAEEDGTGTGGVGAAEEIHEGSNSTGSSLDLEIPLSNCESGDDGVGTGAGAGTGGLGQPGNDRSDPVDAAAPLEQEASASELELALSNFEGVSFSSETQPPPGFV